MSRRGPIVMRHAPGPPSEPGVGVAFFDFDNTIIYGDAGPLFGRYLFDWRRHEMEGRWFAGTRLWLRYVPYLTWMGLQTALYKMRARRRSAIIRIAYKGLRGVPADQFYQMMADFAREVIVPRAYPEMVTEIKAHQKAGRRCVVVTTGMEVLVREVLDHLSPGIELIGCRMHERDGRLTGRVEGPLFGVDKANILHAYCRAMRARLEDSYAYSDHYSDKHMMEAVGHGVAVNPRGRLRKLSHKMGWKILDLAKPE